MAMKKMAAKKLPSYHKALFKYVAIFIFLPILALIALTYINLFNEHLIKAQEMAEQHADAVASSINARLNNLKNAQLRLSANRAVAEVPINILFSQNTLVSLQEFITNNPLAEAVFIQDDTGFIIEAWPIATLRFQSENMSIYTRDTMERALEDNSPRLYWLDPEQYSRYQAGDDTEGVKHLLILSSPLLAETDSVINPYEATGSLNVVLDLGELLQHREFSDDAISKHNSMILGSAVTLMQELAIDIIEPLEATADIDTLLQRYASQSNFQLRFIFDKQAYVSAFLKQSFYEIVPLLVMIPIMMWGLFRLTRSLNKPVHEMVELCKSFASGNYRTHEQPAKYEEFDLLFRRLNHMATTISSQISNLEDAKARAEKSEKIKSQFLANMSHEIRTPMNGVLGMLQLLQSDDLSNQQKERISIAQTSATNLLGIINDILDISKIEANKIAVESITCNVAQLVQGQIDALQFQAEKQGNVLRGMIKQPFHAWWKTDPTRLSQIISNLVSNAIKFTKNGKIMVILRHTESGELEIQVKDTGIGISPEKLSNLFQPFQQADTSTTREYGGTGLGLTITKSLCEIMGGGLAAESTENKGSTFTASIKAIRSTEHAQREEGVTGHSPDSTATSISDPHSGGSAKTAVVAEDNAINQEVLRAMLEDCEITLYFAENGRLAIELVNEIMPDIVLMDVHMPEMDGVEATKQLRKAGYSSPIVMQTANVMKEDVAHYLDIGADDVIAKPLVKEHLIATINKWTQ